MALQSFALMDSARKIRQADWSNCTRFIDQLTGLESLSWNDIIKSLTIVLEYVSCRVAQLNK